MATHQVPQNVEADDKLVGFLSLKQFIFVLLGLGFSYLVFFFFTAIHPIASVIWLPFAGFFLILGLYQRKDQPAEVFLASAIGFYLKPKKRVWSQEGYEERVKITAPPTVEKRYTKDFTGEEAMSRLSRLSLMMDSKGWASRNVNDWQNPNLAVAAESNRLVGAHEVVATQGIDPSQYTQPVDPYDESNLINRGLDQRITENTLAVKEEAVRTLEAAAQKYTNQPPQNTHQSEEEAAAQIIATQQKNNLQTIKEKVIQPLPHELEEQPATPTPLPDTLPSLEDVAVTEPEETPPQQTPEPTATPPSNPAAPKENSVGVARETEDGSIEISLH